MFEQSSAFLTKAQESLAGAQREYASHGYNNCANRSYYAVFQAAIHALQTAGIQPARDQWGHDFVHAQFDGQLVNRRKVFPTRLRGILSRNYVIRQTADYKETDISAAEALHALDRCEMFVVEIRLQSRGSDVSR